VVGYETPKPEHVTRTSAADRLAAVSDQAQSLAAARDLEAVNTVEVLAAVAAVYGSDFDRVLEAHGGDRNRLGAHLSEATG